MISFGPPLFETKDGVPEAKASTTTFPNVSVPLGNKKKSASAYK